MAILSIDTCLRSCGVAILSDGHVRCSLVEEREKGHAERLAIMVREALLSSKLTFDDIDKVAVTVGPGSFTGVRVGLAFARGLAIGRQLQIVPVTTLESLAASLVVQAGFLRVALIDARRGQVYGQVFDGNGLIPLCDAFVLSPELAHEKIIETIKEHVVIPIGSGVPLVFPEKADHFVWETQMPDPVVIARIGAERAGSNNKPEALYLRAPDAKPARAV